MNYSKTIEDKFLPWYRSHGYHVKSLGYGSDKSQQVRFRQFIRAFDLNGRSVLDVGCGFGDFFLFLKNQDIILSKYIGVDLLEDFIEVSKKNIQDDNCRFFTMNFMDDPMNNVLKTDYVVACACLNTEIPNRDNFVKAFLDRMWQLCIKGFAFNMECIHGFKDRRIEINYDPAYWMDFVCRKFTHKIVLFSDYHDADFTICVFKEAPSTRG